MGKISKRACTRLGETGKRTGQSASRTGWRSAGHTLRVGAELLLLLLVLPPTEAALPCQTTQECVNTLRQGSECINNKCTNPYHVGGCLKQQRVKGWQKTRVCHSEDPPEALAKGHCIAPDPNFDYREIRVMAQNWESVFFQAWIIQIVLTEILGIPVTLESGTAEDKVDFYHPASALGYGVSYDYEALRRGHELGDCRNLVNVEGEDYKGCGHVIPEIWHGQEPQWEPLKEEGVIATPTLGKTLGYQGLYIPLFLAAKDTSLLTYLGLVGEANRHKLAATFGRPTSWKDYCEIISSHNCSSQDDPIAKGYPEPGEADRYHVEGAFEGHFRFTEKNDCVKHPTTCTGHVVDYPCGWTSFVKQQTHHLNIALEGNGPDPAGGYSYSQMTEIYAAANATKSNVIMRWWTPEALFQTFLGTDAEFTRVDLPPPTQDCVKARVSTEDRCRLDAPESVRLGDPEGACDEPPFSLKRIFAQSFKDYSNDPDLPEEVRSPAYETINNLQLDGLQIGKIFDYWLKRDSDRYNFDPRDASCRWVAENFETVLAMLPPTYPRVVQDKDNKTDSLTYLSIAFSCLAAAFVVFSFVGVVWKRNTPVMILAQVPFLILLLVGLAMVTTASILLNVAPSDASCMAITWLVSLGYTFELVPLFLKVAAIASLISASRKFRRVRLDKRKLFSAVFAVGLLVVVFLILWTCLDPAKKTAEFNLTDDTTETGDTVVRRTYYCSSNSEAWLFVSVGWQALLLLCGSILAFTTRNMRKDMTESLVVSVLVYSHFMFVILRMLHFAFADRFDVWNLAPYMSLIFSLDIIAACCIYFVPKILLEEDKVTRNPIIPPAFLPPDSFRHVFAQVTKGVPPMDSGILHLPGPDGDGSDDDNEMKDLDPTMHLTNFVAEGSSTGRTLRRNQSEPVIASRQNTTKSPKNVFLESLHASDTTRSLHSSMTSSGNQRPVDILRDSFDFGGYHGSTRRPLAISNRMLGSALANQSTGASDITRMRTILDEETDSIDDPGPERNPRETRTPSLGSLWGRLEEEVQDCDDITTVSC